MNAEALAGLPVALASSISALLDNIEQSEPAPNSRMSDRVSPTVSRAKPVSKNGATKQASNLEQTPEYLVSSFNQSILAGHEIDEAPIVIVMALLCQHYSITIAAEYASSLLRKFGSFGGILRRSAEDMVRVVPLSVEAVLMFKTLHRAITVALREPIENRPIIGTHAALEKYLKFTMTSDEIETIRVIFLNSKNFLLKDELHTTGSIAGVAIYPREIMKRALELCAAALIIVHNHPSGDPTPSEEDVIHTKQLGQLLEVINITLHDHVIVGKYRSFSFKAGQLL